MSISISSIKLEHFLYFILTVYSIDKNEYLLIYHTTAKRHLYDYFIEIVPSHLLQSTRMDDFVYSRK